MALKITYPSGEVVTLKTPGAATDDVQALAQKLGDNWRRNRPGQPDLAFEFVPESAQPDVVRSQDPIVVKGLK